MVLIYEGPELLKRVFDIVYAAIDTNGYTREDPKVIVGIPHPVTLDKVTSLKDFTGFETQAAYNTFVNEKVTDIHDAVKGEQKDPGKFFAAFKELQKASYIIKNPGRFCAAYECEDDVMYFDPFAVTVFLFDPKQALHGEQGHLFNIPAQFSHELVHFDLGASIPFTAWRDAYSHAVYFAKNHDLAIKAAQQGMESFKKWRHEQGGQAFLKKLNLQENKNPLESAMDLFHHYMNERDVIVERIRRARIPIANEALAYNYALGFDLFTHWIGTRFSGSEADAKDVFDKLSNIIKADGKQVALEKVRNAFDVCFQDSADCIEVLLS